VCGQVRGVQAGGAGEGCFGGGFGRDAQVAAGEAEQVEHEVVVRGNLCQAVCGVGEDAGGLLMGQIGRGAFAYGAGGALDLLVVDGVGPAQAGGLLEAAGFRVGAIAGQDLRTVVEDQVDVVDAVGYVVVADEQRVAVARLWRVSQQPAGAGVLAADGGALGAA